MAKNKSMKLANKASDVVRWKPKPHLSVYSDDLPSVKNMEIGKSYQFVVTAKVTELRAPDDDDYPDEYSGRNKETCAHMRITKISEK